MENNDKRHVNYGRKNTTVLNIVGLKKSNKFKIIYFIHFNVILTVVSEKVFLVWENNRIIRGIY